MSDKTDGEGLRSSNLGKLNSGVVEVNRSPLADRIIQSKLSENDRNVIREEMLAGVNDQKKLTTNPIGFSLPQPIRNEDTIRDAKSLLSELSENWASIESALSDRGILKACQVGYHKIYDDRHTPPVGEHEIGVRKLGGVWRVCRGFMDFVSGERGETWTPVVDLPIKDRIALLDHVEKLQEARVKSNAECVEDLKLANEKSKAIYERLTNNS